MGLKALATGYAAITGGNSWFFPTDGSGVLGAQVTAPNDTNENTLWTVNLPILSAKSFVRLTAWYTTSGSGNKVLRAWHGAVTSGTKSSEITITTQSNARIDTHFANGNSVSVQWASGTALTGASTVIASSPAAGSIDTSVATSLILTCTKATGTDSVILKALACEVLKP